jgi:hypothetical protein
MTRISETRGIATGLPTLNIEPIETLRERAPSDAEPDLTLAGLTLGVNSDPWMPRAPVKALLRSGCKVTRHPPRGSV